MKKLLFIFLTIYSNFAFSQIYYYNLPSNPGTQYTSAGAACNAYYSQQLASWNTTGQNLTLSRVSNTDYRCTFDQWDRGSWWFRSTTITRIGNTCPPDQEFNLDEGLCEAPPPDPCSDKNGQSQPFTKTGTAPDAYGVLSGGYFIQSQTACFQGCAVSTADQKCTGLTDGRYSCVGRAVFTGQQCSTSGTSTEVDENANNLPDPQPQVINEQKPCVYSDQGGKQVCQSETKTEKEGQYCGEVNGQKVCVDTKPTKNGITIDTEVETVQNPDGSSTTTKTDTATKTTCTGADQCTSTTIVTTTVTNTDANGNVTGVTGSCTGDSCPDKNGNPDGNGDGFGDCTGDDCSNGSSPSVETPELEEVQSFQETTQAFIDRVQDAPLINAVGSIGLNGSGSCSMTSTQTAIGTISAASFCDNSHWLDPLYFIFLAIHALAAVRVLLSA